MIRHDILRYVTADGGLASTSCYCARVLHRVERTWCFLRSIAPGLVRSASSSPMLGVRLSNIAIWAPLE